MTRFDPGSADAARALIIGGGVGGLAAAVGLRSIGLETAVFERQRDLRDAQVGGAFTIYSNAMRPLDELGVGSQVREAGSSLRRVELRQRRGKVLVARELDQLIRRCGAPSIGTTRTNLHKILTAALGDGILRMGAECTGVEQDEEGVTAQFRGEADERGDLLIGADGSASAIRLRQFPSSERRYSGYTVWQGIAEGFEHERIPEDTLIIWYGKGLRLCLYHVGRGRPYWAALHTTPPGGRDPENGSKQAVLRLVQGWQEPIEDMIEQTPDTAISRMDNFGGAPLARWGNGRVTLLGDAAHPTTIDVGQGACQAIEDAYFLTSSLRDEDDITNALQVYERRRIARTTKIMKLAWRVGSIGQWQNPVLMALRQRFLGVGWDLHMRSLASIDYT